MNEQVILFTVTVQKQERVNFLDVESGGHCYLLILIRAILLTIASRRHYKGRQATLGYMKKYYDRKNTLQRLLLEVKVLQVLNFHDHLQKYCNET
jgi:hypothetical protein